MTTAQQHTDNLLFRMKHLKEFVVQREFDFIPAGVVKFDIQHSVGHPAKIFVHALTQQEAEQQVDAWFGQGAA